MVKIYSLLGVPSHITRALVTSPFLSPLTLGSLRLLLGLYALATSIIVLAHNSQGTSNAGGFFSYFTDLSYIGLISYLFAAATQTLSYVRRRDGSFPLQRWPRVLQFLHILLASTIVVFPVIVTVVYWALLSSSSTFSTVFTSWSNISQHAMNTLFALFEIFCTNLPPSPWIHLLFLEIFLAGYLGVAYITHATQGFYTYSFLNPHKEHGLLAAYIVGIAAGCAIVFSVVKGLMTLRQRLASRRGFGRGSQLMNGDKSDDEGIEDWEEVERPGESV